MIDRRKSPRFDCALEVKYSTRSPCGIQGLTMSRNISRHGIRIIISRFIRKGDALDLDISPRGNGSSVRAVGRVVWAKPMERSLVPAFDAGIEFTRIDQTAINKLIQNVY